jgi:hypothetical protein
MSEESRLLTPGEILTQICVLATEKDIGSVMVANGIFNIAWFVIDDLLDSVKGLPEGATRDEVHGALTDYVVNNYGEDEFEGTDDEVANLTNTELAMLKTGLAIRMARHHETNGGSQ